MALCNRYIVRLINSLHIRQLSTAAQTLEIQEELLQTFRTNESNPANHDVQHFNRFFTIPPKDVDTVFCNNLTLQLKTANKAFAEMSILIRKPALELLNYFRQTDYSKPVNRYVIYGENGCGKTATMFHMMHYGYTTEKIIISLHSVDTWLTKPKEVTNSETHEGLVDLPIDAATWLVQFKTQNFLLLKKTDLRLSKSYTWGVLDTSEKGSPLIDIVDFGINRMKYACDVIFALISELKQASTVGKCQVLVAIDKFNVFYANTTRVKDDTKKVVPASKISLVNAFSEFTKPDWCNGQVVLVADATASEDKQGSYLPRYLLGKGFEDIDPFLPIAVNNFSEEEFQTVMEYYKNKKWIRSITPEGEKELKLLTGCNPYKLWEYCKQM